MLKMGAYSLAIVLAFALGWSGLPGKAMAWATTRLIDGGTIAVHDSVERGVRQALVLEDAAEAGEPAAH